MNRDAIKVWLGERLSGPAGREDYERLLESGWSEVLTRRFDVLVPRASLDAIVDAYLTPDRLAELVRPYLTRGLRDVIEEARKDEQPVGRWLPNEAKERVEKLLMRPGAVDPELIRALFREKAIELMLADTLTATIRDFATLIPKLILSLVPKGPFGVLGGASTIVTKLVEEVERRLEPEVHRYVSGGTKRALHRLADFAVAHADDPSSVELRRNMLRFLLAQPGRVHAKPIDEHALAEIDAIGALISRHIAALPESREQARRALDRFYDRFGDKVVGEVLAAHHVDARPPLSAIADATWPLVQQIHALPAVIAWRERLLDELLDRVSAEAGPG